MFGHVPPLPGEADGAGWRGDIPAGTKPFRLPDWAAQAWPLLVADPDLAGALNAVYEGMQLDNGTPHWHISASWRQSKDSVPVSSATRRATASPGCTHRKDVAEKRFRKALKTVMTNREVEQIWQVAYTLRSFTGHTGTLFGSERTYGYSHYGSLLNMANDAVFDNVILGRLRNASCQVVAKALDRTD